MTETAGELEKKPRPWAIAIFERKDVAEKFKEVLWKRWSQYLTAAISVIAQNDMLKKANPESVYLAVLTAAALDLSVNPNLWQAYILPYGNVAQFQIWYKWFIQLAQRSGKFRTIKAVPVYDKDTDEDVRKRLTSFLPVKPNGEIIWYCAYFLLWNWYEQILAMSNEELQEHGKKFSKSYSSASGLWKKDFEAMAIKTVLKLLISKYAPLSIEMETAVEKDQWVIREDWSVDYIDNEPSMEAVAEWFSNVDALPNNVSDDAEERLS